MSRMIFLLGILSVLSLPSAASAGWFDQLISTTGTVPKAAQRIADQMDEQLMSRIGDAPGGRANVMIVSTVSVSLNDLNESNPLSRQISEEIVNALLAKGYRANELRKGKEIDMHPKKGETFLTRSLPRLATRDVASVAVLAGTYLITPDNVRFNMRLINTPTNEVLAMGSATVPVTREVEPLLSDQKKKTGPPQPSVYTRLP